MGPVWECPQKVLTVLLCQLLPEGNQEEPDGVQGAGIHTESDFLHVGRVGQ